MIDFTMFPEETFDLKILVNGKVEELHCRPLSIAQKREYAEALKKNDDKFDALVEFCAKILANNKEGVLIDKNIVETFSERTIFAISSEYKKWNEEVRSAKN